MKKAIKTIAALVLAASMLLALVGCKNGSVEAAASSAGESLPAEAAKPEETTSAAEAEAAPQENAKSVDLSYENYPIDEVTLLVCFDAGGTGDLGCRVFAKYLEQYINCNVINIAGAGGNVGLAEAIQQPADGSYYVLQAAAFPINAALGTANYTWKDFDPVCMTWQSYMALVVRADSDYQTFDDFKAAVQTAAPETFKFGLYSGGAMNTTYVTLTQALDAKFKVVAIDGKAKSTELLAGRCEAYCDSLASLIPYIESNDFRCLGVFAPSRLPDHPEIPALAEYGIDNIATDNRFGFWAPKGTPEDIRMMFNDAAQKVITDEKFIVEMQELGFYPCWGDIEAYGSWLDKIYTSLDTQLNG